MHATTSRRALLGAAAAVALLAAGDASAQSGNTLTIAAAGPMTGQLASFGEQLKRGATKAVEDLNKAGGVMGKQLVLEVGDDQCDPKQARSVANDLAAKGVLFVAGHFCTGSSIPASEVYAEEGILQITPASTGVKFTDDPAANGIKTIFRTCGRDDQQGEFAGAWLAKNMAGKNVAVVHDKSAYGQGLADLTKAAMNKAGVTEVMYEAITAGEKDYTALVTKMKAAKVDAIYLGGYHPEAALIVKQAREQGLAAPLMSGDSLNTVEFSQLSGPNGAGTMFTNAAEARNLPTAKKAVDEFKAGGYDPEGYTLSTYAAVQIWAAAATKAGSTDAEEVAEAMRAQRWDTVIGSIGFDAKGDLTENTYVWYQFKPDGSYAEAGTM